MRMNRRRLMGLLGLGSTAAAVGAVPVAARPAIPAPVPPPAASPGVGTVMPWAGDTPPPEWMLCDGRKLVREQYRKLFEMIGDAYGKDSLPDLRVRPEPMHVHYTTGRSLGNGEYAAVPSHTHVQPSLILQYIIRVKP